MNKSLKWAYWISTAILVITMLLSGYSYINSPEMKDAFLKLGFPEYFRIELAVAKMLGALVLILPLNYGFKVLAYAGFALTFLSALIAHTAIGDEAAAIISPLIFLGILSASFFSSYKLYNYSLA